MVHLRVERQRKGGSGQRGQAGIVVPDGLLPGPRLDADQVPVAGAVHQMA